MDAAKLETIYGLLWSMQVDKATADGRAASLARQMILEELDRGGQARGIEAASKLRDVFPRGFFTEQSKKMNAAAAVGKKSRWA